MNISESGIALIKYFEVRSGVATKDRRTYTVANDRSVLTVQKEV